MKPKQLASVAAVILLLLYVGLSFVQYAGKETAGKQGILFDAPPGAIIINLSANQFDQRYQEAARQVRKLYAETAAIRKTIAVKSSRGNEQSLLIIDAAEDSIREIRNGENKTILQTTWPGALENRLNNCLKTGSFSSKAFPPSATKNLYH